MESLFKALLQLAYWVLLGFSLIRPTLACELCAIYNASNARNEFTQGFVLSLAEQFTRYGTEQIDGQEIERKHPDFLDESITHFVLGYNFSTEFGLSLNVPMPYRSFRRTDLRYSLIAPPTLFTEQGTDFDGGDVALIGRWTAFAKRTMNYDLVVNLLGGVKFPSGNTDRIKDEVQQSKIFQTLLPPGTPHDPLGHSISSVHEHDLSPGSGSFDGVFGATVNGRWKRWFFNGQFQYSLRTEGESSFQYGDDVLVSGGPGRYLLVTEAGSLSLQLLAVYESMARDELLGQVSDRTGSTAWYLGPQINMTRGRHLTASVALEMPLEIAANGLQSVPDYRIRGGVSWRF